MKDSEILSLEPLPDLGYENVKVFHQSKLENIDISNTIIDPIEILIDKEQCKKDELEDMPPLPIILPTTPTASLFTGISRAFIMYPLYFWFRAPIKLFRPLRVDYLDLARALVPPHKLKRKPGQIINFRSTSIGLLSNAVKKKGASFIPNFVLPPLLVNSVIGIVLFSTYDQISSKASQLGYYAPFLGGGLAGAASSLVATPFDSIKIRMETQQLLDGKHRSMTSYYKQVLNKLGLPGAYRGFGLNLVKDSASFAMFFGVFELSKHILTSRYVPIRANDVGKSWNDVLIEGGCVVSSGILAGASFQAIDYPLERVRSLLLIRAGRLELGKPYIVQLYSNTFKQIHGLIKLEGARNFFYKGFANSLYKAVPSTALGFLVYEGLRQNLG